MEFNEDIERMTEEETQEYIGLQKSISSQSISQYLDILQKEKDEDTSNLQEGHFNE
jgi:hypothetical protein